MNKQSWRLWLEIGFVIALFAAAMLVRVYRLPDFPPGLYSDEAANGLDVYDIFAGHYPVFFERNNGREPLFLYLQALTVALFGATPFGLRLAAAVTGALTIPATYMMVRTLLQTTTLPAVWGAVWTALFLAFSYWHLSLSRLGLRAIMLPLVAALAFWFFWRAWQRLSRGAPSRWRDLVLCGLFLGLALYTYTASRFLPLVVLVVAMLTFAQARWFQTRRWHVVLAVTLIGGVALLVFAPLGAYFFAHPDAFVGRAAAVSVFSAAYGGDEPVRTLGESAARTALMFGMMADGNLRHNPAARPVIDPLLAGWLVAGIALAFWRWRKPGYLFGLSWFVLLALPAVLTAQGSPHSLRAVGMLPAAFLLPVMAMLWAGQHLPGRLARLAIWLPLPFFLFSAVTGMRDYFGAWSDLERFRKPFLVDYAEAGAAIARNSSPESLWVLPLSPNYLVSDVTFSPIEFSARRHANYAALVADEAHAPAQLAAITRGLQTVNMLRLTDGPLFPEIAFVADDVKELLDFLLRKHGRLREERDGDEIGIPYTIYDLPEHTAYIVSQHPVTANITFGDTVMLSGFEYGRAALDRSEAPAALRERVAPAGHTLWAVLRWQALAPIDRDLKTSLLLKDADGHLAGQVDMLLVSDRYPVERLWEAGAMASSYHILPVLQAIPPGFYQLYIKVYEEQSGRIYPARDQAGEMLGGEVALGAVEVISSATPAQVTPERPMPEEIAVAPGVYLIGFDLPHIQLAPGELLPVTFYWRTSQRSRVDYTVHIQMRDAAGAVVKEYVHDAGGDAYPASRWQPGEVLRDWHDVVLPPELPPGVYDLTFQVRAGETILGEGMLDQITVRGRPRLFSPPPLAAPLSGTFGGQVRLLGIDRPEPVTITPGGVLSFTLVWQVEEGATTPLVRFVHVVSPDGITVAQEDTAPCNRECPATTWVAGEVLLDPVMIALPDGLAAARYQLVVGWYDEATQQRLRATDAQGQALMDDLLPLPLADEQME